ncbi:MarR family winged helix-turn-helix transcriptional regulator [Streptomyces sp. M19]
MGPLFPAHERAPIGKRLPVRNFPTLYSVATKSSDDAVDLPAFFDDLVRCETRLYNALNDRLRAAHDIVTSQFEALRYLRDHPGSRVADLAAEFASGIGASSKSVDRLEKRGGSYGGRIL